MAQTTPALRIAVAVLGLTAFTARCAASPQDDPPPPAQVVEDAPAPPAAAADPAPELAALTFEQTLGGKGGVRFEGGLPSYRWSTDGSHLIRTAGRKRFRVDPLTGVETEMPAKKNEAAERDAKLRAGFVKTFGVKDQAARRILSRRRTKRSRDGKTLLTSDAKSLYVHRAGAGWSRLTKREAAREQIELAPDGHHVVFREAGDLRLVNTRNGNDRRVTTDGSEDVLHGKLDWVYQEEVYGRGRWGAVWWSPDSKRIAFLSVDQTAVPRHTLIDYRPTRARERLTRYPKPGDPNPTVRLGVANVAGGLRWIDLKGFPEDVLIVRVGWAPDGRRLVFQAQNRTQKWLDLCLADPGTGKVTKLLRETSDTWVNIIGAPRWLDDGSFLWLSDRTGYRHVYHHDARGKLIGALTTGEWSVRGISRIDEKAGVLWFTGNRESPTEAHAYRVRFDGSELVHLSPGSGTHAVTPNPDGTLFLDRFSSVATPPEMRVLDTDGALVRVLAKTRIKALETHRFATPELHVVPARDGFPLDVLVIKPPDFDPARQYAVWLPTYSGPNAPSVRNRWSGDTTQQFLAQQGCVILRVNVRSASGRGQVTTGACYQQLGVQELRDLEDAVAWLCRNPWADGDRVGISGWSYGGFMAAFALTHSKAFALGVAGAGVYDWRNYDTIYTERYMNTPAKNPAGYVATSCVKAAEDLAGHLVIAHGDLDDNVHVQNALQFAHALQQAGKQFELMIYPGSGHGLATAEQRRHHRELTWRAIRTHLLGEQGR